MKDLSLSFVKRTSRSSCPFHAPELTSGRIDLIDLEDRARGHFEILKLRRGGSRSDFRMNFKGRRNGRGERGKERREEKRKGRRKRRKETRFSLVESLLELNAGGVHRRRRGED